MPYRLPEALRRAVLVWTLVAFGLAQTLGAMHAIVHAPRLAGLGAAVERADSSIARSGWVASLFAHHQHADHACDLYDQLGHADVLPTLALVLPAMQLPLAPAVVHVAPMAPARPQAAT
ncbi:MAG TPA: hypothetical protein VMU47_04565 [Caldimonas sp.]|nr:hypothetical protein [Caldimonas sp.]